MSWFPWKFDRLPKHQKGNKADFGGRQQIIFQATGVLGQRDLTFGLAARLDPSAAASAAVLEMCQMELAVTGRGGGAQ
jgi:hypothetical protein